MQGRRNALSLYHYQGTSRTKVIIEHSNKDTLTGSLINTCIEDTLLEIGLYGYIANLSFPTYYKWISKHSTIRSACEYNYINKTSINIIHELISHRRVADSAIMEWAHKYTTKSSDLKAINRVRMGHGISCITDIVCVNRITRK